jgi:hypothetical protein
MRADVARVLESLRASRRPEFRQLLSDAHLDDPASPVPHPDAVEPYRWLLQRIGDGLKPTAAGPAIPRRSTATPSTPHYVQRPGRDVADILPC